jgi:hypothetical protein
MNSIAVETVIEHLLQCYRLQKREDVAALISVLKDMRQRIK